MSKSIVSLEAYLVSQFTSTHKTIVYGARSCCCASSLGAAFVHLGRSEGALRTARNSLPLFCIPRLRKLSSSLQRPLFSSRPCRRTEVDEKRYGGPRVRVGFAPGRSVDARPDHRTGVWRRQTRARGACDSPQIHRGGRAFRLPPPPRSQRPHGRWAMMLARFSSARFML
jgi:hypothetical protein